MIAARKKKRQGIRTSRPYQRVSRRTKVPASPSRARSEKAIPSTSGEATSARKAPAAPREVSAPGLNSRALSGS